MFSVSIFYIPQITSQVQHEQSILLQTTVPVALISLHRGSADGGSLRMFSLSLLVAISPGVSSPCKKDAGENILEHNAVASV